MLQDTQTEDTDGTRLSKAWACRSTSIHVTNVTRAPGDTAEDGARTFEHSRRFCPTYPYQSNINNRNSSTYRITRQEVRVSAILLFLSACFQRVFDESSVDRNLQIGSLVRSVACAETWVTGQRASIASYSRAERNPGHRASGAHILGRDASVCMNCKF